MSDLLSFKAELLSGTHTCEKCGKSDENSNIVTIKKGNKKEERILCLSCTVKVKQNVEKNNEKILNPNSSNIVSFPKFDNPKPDNIETEPNTQEPSKKNPSKKPIAPIIICSLFATLILFCVCMCLFKYFAGRKTTETSTESTTKSYTSYKSYGYDYDYYTTTRSYTTKSYNYYTTRNSHSCMECGKSASHSMTGISGQTEWYCDKHWEELKEMYAYLYGY